MGVNIQNLILEFIKIFSLNFCNKENFIHNNIDRNVKVFNQLTGLKWGTKRINSQTFFKFF